VRRALSFALAAWLGAAGLFAAVVAPAAFRVLPSRALAGALAGSILPVLFWSGAAVGAWAFLSLWRRPVRRWALILAVALAGASLGSELVVGRAITRLRASVGPDLDAVPATDARRIAFGRLHGLSVLLLGVGMVSAAGLLVHDARRDA
jgi:hypothetical protein